MAPLGPLPNGVLDRASVPGALLMSRRGPAGSNGPLDPLIHETSRLVIVCVLSECESADFNFLLGTTGLTRGNLSAHMAKLVSAGYAEETKQFVNRKQLTQYRLSPAGRAAYTKYREDWINLTKGGTKRSSVKVTKW
jgi:DNA-binding MarR family transcriptional regulator